MTIGLFFLLLAGGDPQADTTAVPPRRDVIVVTGTYEPVSLEEMDRSVNTVDVQSLRLLSGSVADFLQLDPSLDLRERAPDGVQADLSIRGSTFGQTLILLDGLRLNDAQTGHHNLDIPVPLNSLSRVEVLHGSGSALYGSDAVAGVVNFITRSPQKAEFRLRSAAGNFGVNREAGELSVRQRGVSQLFAFSRDFSSGFITNRDYRNLSITSSTHLNSLWGPVHILLAHTDRPFGAQGFYGDFNSWERTRTWFVALHQSLGAKTELSLAFRRHTDHFVLYRDQPEKFQNRHVTEGWQASLRRRDPVSRNSVLHYGMEGYRDSIDSTNLGTHARNRGAAYLSYDVRALRRFSFTLGGRQEVYNSTRGQFSPTVAAGVWLSPHLKLRASVSRAFRLPTYTDLYYHDPANQGSPDLRPEKAWDYEGGFSWNAGRRVRGDVTAFERKDTDGIDYVRRSVSDIWRATNIHRLRFTGVESAVTGEIRRSQRVEFRYTALRGSGDALAGIMSRYVFNYPSHSAVASWVGWFGGEVAARVRLGALQRLGRDPYALVDVSVARTNGRFKPFVQFANLTGTSYQEIPGVPMPGRTFVGGVEVVVYGPHK
jgi:iron complex outermembrane receptor protein